MAINSPSLDIAEYMELSGAGLGVLGTDLFIGNEPENPDFVITVYDTGGTSPNARFLRDEPTVQIRVRGKPGDYLSAWTKAQDIKDALLGLGTQVLSGTNYVMFLQVGDVQSIGRDENDRPLIVTNWQLVREMSSGGNRIEL